MPRMPNLLNDDGTASIATTLMMSHHGFRRDLARFTEALERVARGDESKVPAIREEWLKFRATLHGHHQAEDKGIFPSITKQHGSVRSVTDALEADHRRIDLLLQRGDAAFAALARTEAAAAVIGELQMLLTPHLATEEAEIIPFLREAKVFPPAATDAELELYAEGFAWAMHGIAPDVLERVYALLPENLRARIPAARASFDVRCERVWGSFKRGAARTPMPDSDTE